jgi:hypothetical protein
MIRPRTWPFVLCIAVVSLSPKLAAAQMIMEPPTELQRYCSEQADAQGLHGEERKVFRGQCKEKGIPGGTAAQIPKSPPKAPKGDNGVSIGMTGEQVRKSSWGRPKSINETITARGKHEQWVYGGNYLYFENGVLTSIQTSR